MSRSLGLRRDFRSSANAAPPASPAAPGPNKTVGQKAVHVSSICLRRVQLEIRVDLPTVANRVEIVPMSRSVSCFCQISGIENGRETGTHDRVPTVEDWCIEIPAAMALPTDLPGSIGR